MTNVGVQNLNVDKYAATSDVNAQPKTQILSNSVQGRIEHKTEITIGKSLILKANFHIVSHGK